MSTDAVTWLTNNAEILSKLFGAAAAVAGGIYGFIKIVQYLAKARKRTDEKLDTISKTLSEQHSKDFSEVKETLNKFSGTLDVLSAKMDNVVDRADRVECNVNEVNKNLIEFKGNIEATESTVKRNSDRLENVEDLIDEHETRILTIELARPVKAYKKTSKRKTANRKKKVK